MYHLEILEYHLMLIVLPFIPKPYQSMEVDKVAFAHKTTLAPLCIVLNVPFGNVRIPPHVNCTSINIHT